MSIRPRARQSLPVMKAPFIKDRLFKLSAVVFILMLIFNVMPVAAGSAPFRMNYSVNPQAASTLTFVSEADAQVDESTPNSNAGTSDSLVVVSANGSSSESFIRFTVSGVSGTIQNARLRVYATNDGTRNGPAVYSTGTSWSETGITWSNRPARTSGAADNKGQISRDTWVEYDVTSLVTGNGTFSFVLAGDSSNDVRFSSREGINPPQLVITLNSTSNSPTPTQPPAFTPTWTPTAGSGGTSTFTSIADSYVESSNPGSNYGSLTQIRVDGSPDVRSYLRFNVQGLSGTVTSATLRVYANSAATAGYDTHSVSDNTWSESAITYNNAPVLGGVIGSFGSVSANTWTSINVTSYVTGNGTYNFGLTTSGSTAISFASRESGANAPQLVIQTQGGGINPTATWTPTPAGSPTATRTPTSTPTGNPTATRTPTATPTSASGSAVLVGAGDISSCGNNNDEATARLLDTISGTVFTVGDNAYSSGSYTEYVNCYDPTWGRHKARTQPVPGNHEYITSGAAGYFQYFNNIPSYYAYNLGSWRIYALNSEIDVSASGAQAAWLQSDLNAHPTQCVLAYWHEPRWSSGSSHGSEPAMQTLWQILYNAGAEVVVNGHEHNYERFAEMNASGAAVSAGLREFVVGTGGAGHYSFGSPLQTSQVRDNTSFGVLKLTLRSSGYDWQFIPVAGSTFTDSGSDTCH